MKASDIKFLAVIAGSALVCAGAVALAIPQGAPSGSVVANSTMSTGVTRTETIAPTVVPTPEAVPGITGPAPLPPEEQGLPG
jgi:hypothetical protein